MANYSTLKAAVNAVIKTNGQKEITGEVLNQVLNAMVTSLGTNYQFAGVATPSTNPGTPDQNVFYMATQAGTYTNFNATVLPAGISILLWNGSWSSETFFTIESTPTSGSTNLITSGGVFEKMKLDGGAYDVSAHNGGTTFASLEALLSDANLNTLIPIAVRTGGMSIRFVLTSDNKYVQFRCKTQSFSANTEDWYFEGDDTLEENPEWLRVITDKEGRVLCGLKPDGSIEWAKGIPTPVKDYIDTNITEIWNGNEGTVIDGLTKIISFLNNLSTSTTLVTLLSNKVDKQTGKSLIDETFASAQSSLYDGWYQIIVDSDDKIIEGITAKGIKVISLPISMPSSQITSEHHPEWLKVVTDDDGRILAGIRADGSIYLGNYEVPQIDYVGEPDTTTDFNVQVNCNVTLQSDNDTISDVLDEESMQDCLCTIMLPSNYSKSGKPVPLMICPHGGGGTIENVKSNTLYKYFCANGIAVCDCNGIPLTWAANNSVGTSHCANPMAMECYNKMYQHIIKNYNVEHDVILVGGSMGGMTSIQIAQLGIIPVKGIAVYCPVTDLYNQAWIHSWSNPFPADDVVRLIGLIYGFLHLDSGTNAKFVWDGEKTIGYNPILNGMITMDSEGKIISSDGCYMAWGNTYWQAVEYNPSYSFIEMSHSYSINDNVNIAGYRYNSFKCIQSITTSEEDKTTYPQFVLAKAPEGSHYWKAIQFDGSAPNIEMNHSYAKATSSTDVVVNVPGYNYHSFRCIEPVTTSELDATTLPILATGGIMVKEYHKFPCPIKIWHCKDDDAVGYYCTQRFVNAVRNAGGAAILRPISVGGHGPMGQGPVVANPSGNTDFRGATLTIKGMQEEVYLWINRFVKH